MTTVIVGAGAAGCVLAARLSVTREVTLVEAGPDAVSPPPDLLDARRNSMRAHDWGLWHRPGRRWLRFPYPRGRVVGGSSAVNTCIALRGEPADFDAWAATGLPEWAWARCLPAFRSIERDLDFGEAPWHGSEGPLPIARPKALAPWQAAFVAACERLGFPRTEDHNRPGSTGVGPHAFNRVPVEGRPWWRRVSAAEAWLTPEVRARPQLTLSPDTLVRRVRFQGRRVVGVEVERGGRVEVLPADEVVLAAGAVMTPGVLLRSGVGPRAQVEALGVTCVADVPGVGAQLLDHPGSALFFVPKAGVADPRDPIMQAALRTTSEAGGFPNDLQLQPGGNQAFDASRTWMVTLMCHVGRSLGVSQIRWSSADPRARPQISSTLLEHPGDRAVAVEGMRLAARLFEAPEMRDLATPLWPSHARLRRDDDAHAWIRGATDSGYHPCGTARMGPEEDAGAVTDAEGRVRGVEGLRVADASLFPAVPTSNIHLPVLMVAERIGRAMVSGSLDG